MKRVVLESIEGVAIYPVISLVIFVGMFAIAMLYIVKMDKGFISKMGNLPLSNDELNENEISYEKE